MQEDDLIVITSPVTKCRIYRTGQLSPLTSLTWRENLIPVTKAGRFVVGRGVVVVAGGSVGGYGDRGFELGGGNLLHGSVGRGHVLVWMRWRRWRKLRCG